MEKKNKNLLDLVPIHHVNWIEDATGKITLQKPRFKNKLLLKVIQQFQINETFQIHLDEYGSYIWKECDGNQCIYDIGLKLKKSFGEGVEPVFDRLGLFIKMLIKNQLITVNLKQQ